MKRIEPETRMTTPSSLGTGILTNGYIVLADMYENGFYMHLYSVVEGFDGKGKGQGYELSVVLSSSTDVGSTGEDIYLIILVAGIVIAVMVMVGTSIVGPRVSKNARLL